MNVEVEPQPHCYCRLIVTLTVEEVEAGYAAATRKIAKNARLPGFRPGKAPRALLERHMGQSIEQEALDHVVRSTLYTAISQRNLRAVDRPVLESVSLKRGATGRYVASLELYPEVKNVAYEGLTPHDYKAEVAEADIETRLSSERDKQARTVPVEGRNQVQMGDWVLADFVGMQDGQPIDKGAQKGELIRVQAGDFIPGFVEGLVGQTVPGEANVTVTFPTNYNNAQLAGKPAEFHFTLHELKEQQLPELDDEFARDAGHDSLAAMRESIHKELEASAKTEVERKNEQALLDALIARNPFELSTGIVDRQTESMIQEREQRLAQMLGGRYSLGEDERVDLRTSLRPSAETSVRAGILIDEVAKAAQVTASADAVASYIADWRSRRETAGEARPDDGFDAYVQSEQGLDQIRFNVVRDGVLALLRKSAVPVPAPKAAETSPA